MIIIRAVLLGILQSLTEFFPYSNTTHIRLLKDLFQYRSTYMAYDIVIDMGTVIAICVFYARDIIFMTRQAPVLLTYPFAKNKNTVFWERPYALTLSLILLSCCATAISRFIFRDAGEAIGTARAGMGIMWLFMGIAIYMTKKFRPGNRTAYEMNHQDAFLIGLAQGLTVFPSVARIGITMVVALYLGIERKEAARFSFLLGVPYILSALIYKYAQGAHFYQSDQTALLVSFIAAIFSGVAVLALAVKIIDKGKFYLFSIYCFLIGLFTIFYSVYPALSF